MIAQWKNLIVTYRFIGSYRFGTHEEPPEEPELDIISCEDSDTGKEIEEIPNDLISYLYNLGSPADPYDDF